MIHRPTQGVVEYHTLLVQIAIEEQYHLRIEHRASNGRVTTRIVKPVAHLPSEDGTGLGTLVIRLIDGSKIPFALDEIDHLSIAGEHLPIQQVTRHGLSVGDPVQHPEFGFGAVQAFSDGGDGARVVVRFADFGTKMLSLAHTELRRLGLTPDGEPITGGEVA